MEYLWEGAVKVFHHLPVHIEVHIKDKNIWKYLCHKLRRILSQVTWELCNARERRKQSEEVGAGAPLPF